MPRPVPFNPDQPRDLGSAFHKKERYVERLKLDPSMHPAAHMPDEPPAYWKCVGCRTPREYGNGLPEFFRQVLIQCEGTCGDGDEHVPHVFSHVGVNL